MRLNLLRSNLLRTLLALCLGTWFLAVTLLNSMNQVKPPTHATAEVRWARLSQQQKILQYELERYHPEFQKEPRRQLIAVLSQQNQFREAEVLATSLTSEQEGNAASPDDLGVLAAVEREVGDYDKAIASYERIAVLASKGKDATNKARALNNLGTMLYLNGLSKEKNLVRQYNFEKASACFSEALKLSQSQDKNSALVEALTANSALNGRELSPR